MIVLLVLFTLGTAITHVLGECPAGFVHLSDGCYSLGTEQMSQLDASDYCASLGGNLAEFTTCTAFEHIVNYLSLNEGLAPGNVWVGAHSADGAWTWDTDGSSIYYGAPLWDPMHDLQEGEDCALLPQNGGYMKPDSCENLNYPFCEAAVVRSGGGGGNIQAVPKVECPEPFVEIGGRCFSINDEFLSWDNARARCAELGGDNFAGLAVLEDCTIFSQVTQYIAEQKGAGEWVWIGARDFDLSGSHKWLSGVEVTKGPSFWCPGQPNNFLDKQACVMLWGSRSYYGADEDCSVFHKSLCEIGY